MPGIKRWCGVTLWLAMTSALSAAQALQPLTDPDRPVEIPGVRVLPPKGDGWFLFPVSAQETVGGRPVPQNGLIRFVRRLSPAPKVEEGRQIVAAVMVIDSGHADSWTPEAFLEWHSGRGGQSARSQIGHMVTPRQRLMAYDERLDRAFGETCVRYTRVTEEYGQVPTIPDLVVTLSTEGIDCYHPNWPEYIVGVTFQQSYARGYAALPLDADSFLKGLRFTPVRPQPLPPPS